MIWRLRKLFQLLLPHQKILNRFQQAHRGFNMKAAIYHFTDGSELRPGIYKKQLNILKDYALSLGCTDIEVFCDMSLLISEHPEFNRLLSCVEQFDILVVKDFYHLNKNTMRCMDIIRTLKEKGVQIYTIENGSFNWDEVPLGKPLRVATYCCRFGSNDEIKQIIPIQNDILKLFTNKKTQWAVLDQYFDISQHQNNGEQVELMKLIENKDKYDILMVHNLNDVHWRTVNFCRLREQLQLDMYSLQDGFLPYKGR